MNLTFHFHLIARKKMSGGTPLPLESQYAIWPDVTEVLHLVITTLVVKNPINNTKPSQAKVLTEGGDLREAQVDIPLSVIHSRV